MSRDALGEVLTESRGGRTVLVRRMLVAPAAVESIVTELTAAMKLEAASIFHPTDVKVDGGLVTVTTQAEEGHSLRGLLTTLAATGEKLPVSHCTWLAIKVLEALEHAHAQRVFHGRLSPEHVVLTPIGEVRVTGFGLEAAAAHLVKPQSKTDPAFAYVAPEQVGSRGVGSSTDVFAVGAMLAEALLGRPLFLEDTFAQTFDAVTSRPLPAFREARDNVPKALDEALQWALDKDADRRSPRPEALRQRLEAFQGMLDVGDRIKPYEHPKRLADLMRLRMKKADAALDVTSAEPVKAQKATKRRRPVLALLRLMFVAMSGLLGWKVFTDWRELEPQVRAKIPPDVLARLGIDPIAQRTAGAEQHSGPRGAGEDVVPLPLDAGVEAVDAGTEVEVPDVGAPEPRPARLTVESVPPKATVVLDGKSLGVTPLTEVELAAGEHTLVVTSKKPKIEVSQTLSVAEGEVKKVSFKLRGR
ncbi:MAG: PEGA domain-containing protein [Myxococcaceae bacterium]|nr:PEGA domain-containing protein [Myxococcaceae bacterium]